MINKYYFDDFNGNQGLSIDDLKNLNLPLNLPSEYYEFLQIYNGGEGFIGPEHVILFKAEELISINENYEINEFMPGLFIIGSNGADEALAIDAREKNPKYILIPFVFEEEAIIILGNDLNEFFDTIYKKGFFIEPV